MNTAFLETSEAAAACGIAPLVAVLRQLADLLRAATDEQYVMKPANVVSSNIGGHVRHCLDHVETLLGGAGIGVMSYDDRQRGTDVEKNRLAALEAIARQMEELHVLRDGSLDLPIRLRVLMAATGPSICVETTLGRELAFVISHTVHHNALIGVIAKLVGVPVPDRFGYAPSTLAHMEKRKCAR
jgi:hypothetical protein